jgi:uncharacterized repeat protein (TIGR01451 family)
MLNIEFNQIAALPALPSSLIFLRCRSNLLTSLPALPSTLIRLECGQNQLTSLPALPSNLYALYFYNNQIPSSALPAVFPNTLGEFSAASNPLTVFPNFSNCTNIKAIDITLTQIPSVPPLPPTLTDFRCSHVMVNTLPTIPSGLIILDADNCNLSILPALPNGLQALKISNNPIINFPAVLPDSLQSLIADSVNLTALPTLPTRLYLLSCNDNFALSCLPLLPSRMDYISVTNTAITCLPNQPLQLSVLAPSSINTICNGSSTCALYPEVKGKAFIDINNNGQQDAGDMPLAERIVQVQPNNWTTITDVNGNYSLHVPANTAFTETTTSALYYTTNPSSYAVNLAMGQIDSLNDFAFYPTPNVNDLEINTTSSVARPGFDMSYWITYKNVGTTTLSGSLSFTYNNGVLTYINSSIAPSSQSGNIITWNYTNLAPFASGNIHMTFNILSTTPLGTSLQGAASILPSSGDATALNNTDIDWRVVQGAYDPNEKLVNIDLMTPSQLNNGQEVEYTIFFQNTGTDTAFNIKVLDTLSQSLNISTLKILSSSHPYDLSITSNRVLNFHFPHILLPDSNINEVESHGFVKYRILAQGQLQDFDTIHNKADIYFDYNVPIVTNDAIILILAVGIEDGWAKAVNIYPNPAQTKFVVEFTEMSSPVTLSLLDMNGRTVLAQTLTTPHGEVDVKDLAEGIYTIRLESEKGVITRKLGLVR